MQDIILSFTLLTVTDVTLVLMTVFRPTTIDICLLFSGEKEWWMFRDLGFVKGASK